MHATHFLLLNPMASDGDAHARADVDSDKRTTGCAWKRALGSDQRAAVLGLPWLDRSEKIGFHPTMHALLRPAPIDEAACGRCEETGPLGATDDQMAPVLGRA